MYINLCTSFEFTNCFGVKKLVNSLNLFFPFKHKMAGEKSMEEQTREKPFQDHVNALLW